LRNQIAVYVATFFASLGFSFVTPLMPLLTLELLDGDFAQVGLWIGVAIGIGPLLTAATAPYWGMLGDRYGQKRMMQRALVAIGVCIALMAALSHPWQLLGLRAVIGALGGISVAALAAITVSSRKQSLGRNIGLLQSSQTFGQVVGPLIGGGLAVAAGMRPTFLYSAALFTIGLVLVTWLYRDLPAARPPARETSAEARQARRDGFRSPAFWAMLGVLFSANFLDGSFVVFLPLLLPILGAPTESLSLLAGIGLSGGALAMAISATLVGRLTGRVSSGTLILAMVGGGSAVLLAMFISPGWLQLLVLRAALGLTAGALPTVAYAAAASFVPADRRGAAVGLASSAGLIGWAVAPLVVGALLGISPRAVFLVDLLMLVASGLGIAWVGGLLGWLRLGSGERYRLALFSR
jgi:MFS family permease